MIKYLLLTAILLPTFYVSPGQDAYKQDLAGLATVSFPAKPGAIDTLSQKVYSWSDQMANYIVVINDMSKQANFQLKEGKLDGFYDGAIDGFISASKGKLISRKEFKLNGLKGTDFEFTSDANPNLPDLRFVRILFLNNTFIAVNFWTFSKNKLSTQNERTRYFNSFVVTADKGKIKQFTLSKDDYIYNVSYRIGKVLGGLLVVAIVTGFIILIKNGIKKLRRSIRKTPI